MNDSHLVVRRDDFELRQYVRVGDGKRFTLHRAYEVAIGQVGLETPAGFYWVTSRSRHPDYQYPDSDWVAPALRGALLRYGEPDNPIAGRWLGLAKGIGIHGTFDDDSIGQQASHGCVRMHERDVIALFDVTPLNTPVFIY